MTNEKKRPPRRVRRMHTIADEAEQSATAASRMASIRDEHAHDWTDPYNSTDPAIAGYRSRQERRTARRAITYTTESRLRSQRRDHNRAIADERHADRLERRADMLEQARDESSPQRAVIALATMRTRALWALLAISVALSVGSAIGLSALSAHMTGRMVDGFIAELAGTAISTASLLYLAHIHRWAHAALPASLRRALWTMAFAPTAASAGANIAGITLGAPVSFLNAVCALGALSASTLAYLVARSSATEIRTQGQHLSELDARELRNQRDQLLSSSPHAHIPEDGNQGQQGGTSALEEVLDHRISNHRAQGAELSAENLAFLAELDGRMDRELDQDPNDANEIGPDQEKQTPDPEEGNDLNDANETGAEQEKPTNTGPDNSAGSVGGNGIGAEQEQHGPHHGARMRQGQHTRDRIAAYLQSHPGAETRQIARELGLSRTTVRDHRRALQQ